MTNYVGIRAEESPCRAKMLGLDFDEAFDCWIERPILDWTVAEVFEIHRRHHWKPNPLYLKGVGRVGCYPCIMVNHKELKALDKYFPGGLGSNQSGGENQW